MLVVCKKTYHDLESRLFNPINKKCSDIDIRIKRKGFAVVYYLSKVYIVGGWFGRQTVNSIIIYDPVSETQQVSRIRMIQARNCHEVIVYKKKLFVFGGYGKDGYLNTVEMFSPKTNKFVRRAPMKIARSSFACCRVGNLVYVIGGATCFADTQSVEIYNMDSNTWTDGVDYPVIKWFPCACDVNNKL